MSDFRTPTADYSLLKPFTYDDYQNSQAKSEQLQNLRGTNQERTDKASLAEMRRTTIASANGDMGLAQMRLAQGGDPEGAAMLQKYNQSSGKYDQDTAKNSADLEVQHNQANRRYLNALIQNPNEQTFALVQADAERTRNEPALNILKGIGDKVSKGVPIEGIVKELEAMHRSLLTPGEQKQTYVNAGDRHVPTNPFAAQGEDIPINISAAQAEQIKTAQRNAATSEGQLNLRKRQLTMQELKDDPKSVKNKAADEKAKTSANNSIKMLDEMEKLANSDPRSTATLAAPLARFAESVMAFWEPSTPSSSTPAIRMNQLRDSFLATVEALKKDGRMSNQDRQRLENAIGSGSFTSPESTKSAIAVVRDIVKSMSNQGGSDKGNWTDL